jgi:hypothetical protein
MTENSQGWFAKKRQRVSIQDNICAKLLFQKINQKPFP